MIFSFLWEITVDARFAHTAIIININGNATLGYSELVSNITNNENIAEKIKMPLLVCSLFLINTNPTKAINIMLKIEKTR